MLFQGLATQKKQFPGHTLVRTLGRAHAYHLSRGLVHPNGAHPGMTTPPFASQGLVPWLRNGPSSEGFSQKGRYPRAPRVPLCPVVHAAWMAHCPVEGLDSVKGASVHSRLNFSRWGRSLWDGVRHTERLGTPSLVRTQAAKSVAHATPFRAPMSMPHLGMPCP